MAMQVLADIIPSYLDAAQDRACMMLVHSGIRATIRKSTRKLTARGGMHDAAVLLHMLLTATPNVTALDVRQLTDAAVLDAVGMASAVAALADLNAAASAEQAAAAKAKLAAATDWEAGATALGRLQELKLRLPDAGDLHARLLRLLSLCTGLTRLELGSVLLLPLPPPLPIAAGWGAGLSCLIIHLDALVPEPEELMQELGQLRRWLEQQKPPLVEFEIDCCTDDDPGVLHELLRIAIAAGHSGCLRELCTPASVMSDAWLEELCHALHGRGCQMRRLRLGSQYVLTPHVRDPFGALALFQQTLQELCTPAPEEYSGGQLSALTALTSLSVQCYNDGGFRGVLADLQHLSGLRALRIYSDDEDDCPYVGADGSTRLTNALRGLPHLERLELSRLWGIDLAALLGALRPDKLHTLRLNYMVSACRVVPGGDHRPGTICGVDACRDAMLMCMALGLPLSRLTGLRELDLRNVVRTEDHVDLHRVLTLAVTLALPKLTHLVTFWVCTANHLRAQKWQAEARRLTQTLLDVLADPRICPALTILHVHAHPPCAFAFLRPGVTMT